LVAAVREESGTTEVYDAVVYPEYASVGLVSDDGVERKVFRDGRFLDSFRVRTPATGNRVDLAAIDPDTIARLPQITAERLGVDDPGQAYVIVHALQKEPQIIVYIQTEGNSQYRVYGLDGNPTS
jgi:hypothetical protein